MSIAWLEGFMLFSYVFMISSTCFIFRDVFVLFWGASSRLVRLDLGAGTGLLAALACKAQLCSFVCCMGALSRLINLKKPRVQTLERPHVSIIYMI